MKISKISMTKSVTKQIREYEPVRVEVTVDAELLDSDDHIECSAALVNHVNSMIRVGFDNRTSGDVETAKAEVKEEIKVDEPEPSTAAKKKTVSKKETQPAEKKAPKRRPAAKKTTAKKAPEKAKDDEPSDTEALGSDSEDIYIDDVDLVGEAAESPSYDIPEFGINKGDHITDNELMQYMNVAVQSLQAKGVREVLDGFNAQRASQLKDKDRYPFLKKLAAAIRDRQAFKEAA